MKLNRHELAVGDGFHTVRRPIRGDGRLDHVGGCDINPRMQSHAYAVLQAPSTLGLEADGAGGLGDRLLELGLARDIHARFAGRLSVPAKQAEPDPKTGVLNAEAIAAWSPRLADAVA